MKLALITDEGEVITIEEHIEQWDLSKPIPKSVLLSNIQIEIDSQLADPQDRD